MQIELGIEKQDTIGALYQEGTFFGSSGEFNSDGGFVQGVLVSRMPYAVRDDVWVMAALVLSFLLLCYVLSKGRGMLSHSIKDFFVYRERENMFVETGQDLKFQVVMFLFNVFMLTLLFYSSCLVPRLPSYQPRLPLLAGLMAAICLFYVIKYLLYLDVNWTFFSTAKSRVWIESYQTVLTLQGLALLPITLMAVFSNVDPHTVLVALAVVIAISKLVLFVRAYVIFFDHSLGLLRDILYLCALEMIPALTLVKLAGIITSAIQL